jgi:hypothetical protein
MKGENENALCYWNGVAGIFVNFMVIVKYRGDYSSRIEHTCQILTSKHLFPLKGTNSPWRND